MNENEILTGGTETIQTTDLAPEPIVRPAERCPRCGGPLGYPPFGGAWGCVSMACRLRAAKERLAVQERGARDDGA